GGAEDLAHATGGQDHRGGVNGADTVVLPLAHDVQGDARGTALGVREEVQDQGVLDGAQAAGADRVDQGAGDLGAGGVAARVGDAAAVVAALAGEGQAAFGGLVEVGAGGDQPAHRVGALGDEDADRLLVAQARAGDQRVVEVLFGSVAVTEGRGDAALRPPGGAVVEPGLGDDARGEAGRFAAQGGGEAGDAGADDHHVRRDGPPGRGRVQAGAGARLGVVVGDGRRGAGAKRTRLRVVVGDGRAYACAGHEAAPNVPKVRGMLSISRVDPTRAATASTASPVK